MLSAERGEKGAFKRGAEHCPAWGENEGEVPYAEEKEYSFIGKEKKGDYQKLEARK